MIEEVNDDENLLAELNEKKLRNEEKIEKLKQEMIGKAIDEIEEDEQ